jgi:hypothetical protein
MRLSILDTRIAEAPQVFHVGDEVVVVGRMRVVGVRRELIDVTGHGATTMPQGSLGELAVELVPDGITIGPADVVTPRSLFELALGAGLEVDR